MPATQDPKGTAPNSDITYFDELLLIGKKAADSIFDYVRYGKDKGTDEHIFRRSMLRVLMAFGDDRLLTVKEFEPVNVAAVISTYPPRDLAINEGAYNRFMTSYTVDYELARRLLAEGLTYPLEIELYGALLPP